MSQGSMCRSMGSSCRIANFSRRSVKGANRTQALPRCCPAIRCCTASTSSLLPPSLTSFGKRDHEPFEPPPYYLAKRRQKDPHLSWDSQDGNEGFWDT